MNIKTEKVILQLFLFLLPAVSFAAGDNTLALFAGKILDVMSVFPRLFIALALAYFLYGVLGYVTAGDDKTRRQGKDVIVYGILGLFVMVSVWGLVNLVRTSLGI